MEFEWSGRFSCLLLSLSLSLSLVFCGCLLYFSFPFPPRTYFVFAKQEEYEISDKGSDTDSDDDDSDDEGSDCDEMNGDSQMNAEGHTEGCEASGAQGADDGNGKVSEQVDAEAKRKKEEEEERERERERARAKQKRKVPDWARGEKLRSALRKQHEMKIDPEKIFPEVSAHHFLIVLRSQTHTHTHTLFSLCESPFHSSQTNLITFPFSDPDVRSRGHFQSQEQPIYPALLERKLETRPPHSSRETDLSEGNGFLLLFFLLLFVECVCRESEEEKGKEQEKRNTGRKNKNSETRFKKKCSKFYNNIPTMLLCVGKEIDAKSVRHNEINRQKQTHYA